MIPETRGLPERCLSCTDALKGWGAWAGDDDVNEVMIMTVSDSKPRGILCPVCGQAKLYVTRTHHPALGITVRYRKCRTPGCRGRVVTEERARNVSTPALLPASSHTATTAPAPTAAE